VFNRFVKLLIGMLFVSLLVVSALGFAADKYPIRAINDVVFSSAGGGTDVVNRFASTMLEKEFKQKILVSNMPGGLGGTAAEYVWQQPHDGYTWLGVSETATTFLVNRATKHGSKDWVFFIVGGSPGVIAVKADSPYHSLDDLLKEAKEKARGIKISNSGLGKLWHIKASILEKSAGVQFMHVPYNGSNPAILSVLSGETNAVSAALGEVAEQVRAGKLRVLVVTENKRVSDEGFANIPAITEKFSASSKFFPSQQWLGFAVPKDTPKNVVKALETAFAKVMADPEMTKFLKSQYLDPIGLSGGKATEFAVKMESNLSWISKELGVAKIDPAALKIAKPSWLK
jgi:tripartite-type tricarboxylate transporter receptor subunit TctC